MKRVIIESPYAGDVVRNINYARACLKHSLSLDEAPIASHLLYTQPGILIDDIPEQRQLGIKAGLAWRDVAEYSAFYTDLGWSSGMLHALHTAIIAGYNFRIRALENKAKLPATLDDATKKLLLERIDYDHHQDP